MSTLTRPRKILRLEKGSSSSATKRRAHQVVEGVGLVIVATLVAEISDFSRFSNPRQLLAYLGLGPGEHSGGSSYLPRGATKASNTPFRALVFRSCLERLHSTEGGARLTIADVGCRSDFQGHCLEGSAPPARPM